MTVTGSTTFLSTLITLLPGDILQRFAAEPTTESPSLWHDGTVKMFDGSLEIFMVAYVIAPGAASQTSYNKMSIRI